MKKILFTVACLFIASQAYADVINNMYLDVYDASGTFSGYHTNVTGSLDTAVASGSLDCVNSFFNTHLSLTEQWVSTTAGENTWKGTNALPITTTTTSGAYTTYTPYNYTFTMAAGDVAFGLYFDFDWQHRNIPTLSVMHPNGDGSYSPVDQVWYKGTDTTPKTGMQTLPFPGVKLMFGAAPVPEPASLLLIGSGLAGLAGLSSRRRRGRL